MSIYVEWYEDTKRAADSDSEIDMMFMVAIGLVLLLCAPVVIPMVLISMALQRVLAE